MENKFKIGDKVRVKWKGSVLDGKVGVIMGIGVYTVELGLDTQNKPRVMVDPNYLELEENKVEKVKFLEVLSNKKYHSKDYLFELNGMYYWWTDSSNGITGSIPLQFVSCSKEQYEDIDPNYEWFPCTLVEVTLESDLLVIKKPESNYYLCYDEYDSRDRETTIYWAGNGLAKWSDFQDHAKIFTSKEKKELEDNYPMHPGWYFTEVE